MVRVGEIQGDAVRRISEDPTFEAWQADAEEAVPEADKPAVLAGTIGTAMAAPHGDTPLSMLLEALGPEAYQDLIESRFHAMEEIMERWAESMEENRRLDIAACKERMIRVARVKADQLLQRLKKPVEASWGPFSVADTSIPAHDPRVTLAPTKSRG